MTIWGTGTPRREFLHVDDLADAAVHVLTHYDDDIHLNVGVGEDIAISDLADARRRGRRMARSDRLRHVDAGRHAAQAARCAPPPVARLVAVRSRLRDGIESTYAWFVEHLGSARGT